MSYRFSWRDRISVLRYLNWRWGVARPSSALTGSWRSVGLVWLGDFSRRSVGRVSLLRWGSWWRCSVGWVRRSIRGRCAVSTIRTHAWRTAQVCTFTQLLPLFLQICDPCTQFYVHVISCNFHIRSVSVGLNRQIWPLLFIQSCTDLRCTLPCWIEA